MIGINEETIKAYTEIGCLLKFFPSSYVEKLPNKLLEFISNVADRRFIIVVDTNKRIDEQNISKKAKNILGVLTYNYWSNIEQKEDLKLKLFENEKEYQNNLSSKYNTDNLFKNRERNNKNMETEENKVQMIEYKENIFIRLFRFIKGIFKSNTN